MDITWETMFGKRKPSESWIGTVTQPSQQICHWQGLGSSWKNPMTMSCFHRDLEKLLSWKIFQKDFAQTALIQ